MAGPLLSVLLPAYNSIRTLPAALRSLWEQQPAATAPVPDLEVIVVDDGSTDGSAAFLTEEARHRPALQVLHREHGGIAQALNAALAVAKGALLARMDADDVMQPQRLALQTAHLLARPELALSATQVDFGGDAAAAGGFAHFVDWQNSLLSGQEIARGRFRDTPVCHPSVMFRPEAVARWGGYADGDFAEDWELWLRWLDAGALMEKLPQKLLCWNDAPDRATRTDSRYRDAANDRLRARWLARELRRSAPAGADGQPEVWVLGGGRMARRRLAPLWREQVRCRAFVDIDPHKTGNVVDGVPVVGREALLAGAAPGHCCILNALTAHGAAEEAALWLTEAGYGPTDWWLA